MNTLHIEHPLALTASLLLALAASAPVLAAGKSPASAAETSHAIYKRDTALCMSPRYASVKADCLSEASTARASREPASVDPDPGRYMRNALMRCEPLPDPDRSDCVARIQGKGTTSGSVAGGGIYRELVTREVGVAPEVPPSAPAK